MTNSKAKIHINESLAKKLIAEQFPQWVDLPLTPVDSAGTDNALFRLGRKMAVRLPRFHRVASHVEKEQEWLPKLAPFLPLTIPTPIGKGMPTGDYPWHWSIYLWIEGETATPQSLLVPARDLSVGIHSGLKDHVSLRSPPAVLNLNQAATSIGQFIAALQRIDPTGGPPSGQQNGFRGFTLAHQNPYARVAIKALKSTFDTTILTACWDAALRAPAWHGPPVWLHGDLHEGNLLTRHGALSAVIDFGLLGVGDPASDLMVGWTLLSSKTRKLLRKELVIDEATWERGRGWALSFGLIALACYLHSNPILASIARKTIEEVLSD